MALAYPLGECYFKRTGLDTPQPEGFYASDPDQFSKRMLVEFIWNKPAYHGAEAAKLKYDAGPEYPDLCSYVHINCTRMRQAEIWIGGELQEVLRCNNTTGLPVLGGKTLGPDIDNLVQLLSLPRQLRKGSPFQSRLLKLVSYTAIKSVPYEYRYSDSYDISWPTVAKANFGVDVQWRPVEKTNWWGRFLKQTPTYAIGFVPFSGAIMTPEGKPKTFHSRCAYRMIEDITRQPKETRKFLPDLWHKLDLPLHGRTDSSVVGISGPLGSISVGQKPAPDPEREANLEVFPGAKKPVALAEEHPKHETFLVHNMDLELLGADASWKPADENFEKLLEVAPGDSNAPELVHGKNEVVEFGNP
ncbi:hypothetical protein DL762_005394 [Monosporascus cannonballus]|uniref:Uncharacterized protein n=1 Tax=Monosporascus cannonballus TaxID=155416 RepID=A0ABY0H9K6_9PEZI|nr:hypothetical protein DL762_005394 [Monosporascus cannonballus]